MLKKSSSQKPLSQFESNLAGSMLGGWGFISVQMKGLAPFGSQSGAQK